MAMKHSPRWIKAFPEEWGWSAPEWNRELLKRMDKNPKTRVVLDKIAESGDQYQVLALLEECMLLGRRWRRLPKVTGESAEKKSHEAAEKIKKAADFLQENYETLRGHRRCDLLGGGVLEFESALRKLAREIVVPCTFEGDPELLGRPSHPTAFRTFALNRLLEVIERHGIHCTQEGISILVDAVVDSPGRELDVSTVRKARNRGRARVPGTIS